MVWAQAIAACSTTRRNSRERSESIELYEVVSKAGTTSTLSDAPARGSSQRVGRSPAAEHVIGLHDLVDLARALVDHRALAVAIEAADRVLVGVAVGAVHLHGVAGGALRGDGREPLRQAGLARVAPAVFFRNPARSHSSRAA